MAILKSGGPIIGDKVDITKDDSRYYKTIVGDILDSGLIMVGMPILRGGFMHLELSDEAKLAFYRETGRYTVVVRVADFETKDEVTYVLLEQLTEPEKNQRREFYRLPENADVWLYKYTDGDELTLDVRAAPNMENILAKGRTRDLSVSGLALLTGWECSFGEKFLLVLMLSDIKGNAKPFFVCAEVKRVSEAADNGMYNVGMRFTGITKDRTEFLYKHILTQQQKRRMQRLLVEGS